MFNQFAMRCAILVLVSTSSMFAVDPYFLRRSVKDIEEKEVDVSTETAHYRPVFGVGASGARIVRSVARYGELTVEPGGASGVVSYAHEEQIYFILDGAGLLHYGGDKIPVKKNDFMYLPANVEHGLSNPTEAPCRLLVMGFRIPAHLRIQPTRKLLIASTDDVGWTPTHGPGSKFKLLLGDRLSRRDKLAAGHVITSLFLMEFDPGVNNKPHHHDSEEEIYYVLRGEGEITTGAGPTGEEGRYPVKAGDVYFFRLNATVGFNRGQGKENPRILAVRSLYPFRKAEGTRSK